MSGQAGQYRLLWSLRITEERCDGVLVLSPAGRLSHSSAGALDAALTAAIEREKGGLVIDLGKVDYASSAGLLMIAAAARLAHARGVLVLCALTEPVRIALDLAGLLPHVAIEPSRERAIARIASPTGSGRR